MVKVPAGTRTIGMPNSSMIWTGRGVNVGVDVGEGVKVTVDVVVGVCVGSCGVAV